MKDFLRNTNWWPNRAPKLNTQHPLYSQAHMTNCAVANLTGGMTDLVTGKIATNTAVVNGVDENGPYVLSTTGDGTGEITFAGPGSAANFITVGCIFKFTNTNKMYPMTVAATTGWFMNTNSTVNFVLNNGTFQSVPLISGHTYYVGFSNGPATSGLARTIWCYDMTAGFHVAPINSGTVSGNVAATAITYLVPFGGSVSNLRVYAGFASGSPGSPFNSPWYQIPPRFYGQHDMFEAIRDPWSLWYA